MFKIAWSGLKGRKKDSLMNGLIILLSMVFIIVSTTIFSSLETTKKLNLMSTFGTWRESGKVLKAVTPQVAQMKWAPDTGVLDILGKSSDFGIVGTYNAEFMEQAHMKMIEGRLPEASDEMVMTYSQTSRFPEGIALGDTVLMELEIPLKNLSADKMNQMNFVTFKSLYGPYFDAHLNAPNQLFISLMDEKLLKKSLNHGESKPIEWETYQERQEKYHHFYNSLYLNPLFRKMNEIQTTAFLNEFLLKPYKSHVLSHLQSELLKESVNFNSARTFERQDFNGFSLSVVHVQRQIWFKDFVKAEEMALYKSESDYNATQPYSEEIVKISIPIKVVGFMDDYTDNWTLGKMKLPNSMIHPDMYKNVVEAIRAYEGIDSSHHTFDKYIFTNQVGGFTDYENGVFSIREENVGFYKNEGADTSKEDRLLIASILLLIFVTTCIAIFQINLFQIRKRVKRFGLLKAIGATRIQLKKLLLNEMMIYMGFAIPLGLSMGLLLSFCAIKGLNVFYHLDIQYAFKWAWLLSGVMITFVSVVLGMSYSYYRAIRAPFNAHMVEVPRHQKLDKKFNVVHRGRLLTFRNISIHQVKSHYKKNLLSFFLCTVVITALLSAIALAYAIYSPYYDDVIIANVPDFSIELPHGMRSGHLKETRNKLTQIEGVETAEAYRTGDHTYMSYKDLFSELPFKPTDEKHNKSFFNFKNTPLMKYSKKVDAYGIDTEGDNFENLCEHLKNQSFDIEAFQRGDSAILILPRYHEDQYSLNFKYENLYDEAYNVQLKSPFVLMAPADFAPRTGPLEESREYALARCYNVGAVIHGFDHLGIWPLSNMNTNPIVLVAEHTFKKLYKKNGQTINLNLNEIESLGEVYYPISMGKTLFTVKVKADADLYKVQSEIRTIAARWGVKPYNHMVDKAYQKQKIFKMIMVVLIFGISVASIAMMIIFNLVIIKVENERERIGILQAIGVKASQFKRLYRNTGILFGLGSFMVATLVVLGIVQITVGSLSDIIKSKGDLLYDFPWIMMLGIGFVYVFICARVHYKPIKCVIENQPIYNIQVNQN